VPVGIVFHPSCSFPLSFFHVIGVQDTYLRSRLSFARADTPARSAQIYADLVAEVSKSKTISELKFDKVSNPPGTLDDALSRQQDVEGRHGVGSSSRFDRHVAHCRA